MSFRIATYNLHRCIGRDGIHSPERIAAVLNQIDADIAALQEVPLDVDQSGESLNILARALEAEAIQGPTLLDSKGRFGNAVLTRIAPAEVQLRDISVPGREPRGAIAVLLRLNGRSVKLIATHLGLRLRERRHQMRRLMPLLDHPVSEVTILMGDFNEWFHWAPPLRQVNRRFGTLPAPATFPSSRPLLALDRIWVQPADKVIGPHTYRSSLARIASDHLPLVARVHI